MPTMCQAQLGTLGTQRWIGGIQLVFAAIHLKQNWDEVEVRDAVS
jgi:hypothetical protein